MTLLETKFKVVKFVFIGDEVIEDMLKNFLR